MRLEIDARRFAVLRAERAVLALVLVEMNLQERETGKETEHRAYRTDGVAVGASASPGQDEEDDYRRKGYDEHGQRLHPHVDAVEGVAFGSFGDACQHVVAQHVKRLENAGHDASKGAVGRQQLDKAAYAGDDGDDEERRHDVAQPFLLRRVGVAVLLRLLAQPSEDVLHDAQRTDDRAVDASEDKR